MSIVVIIVCVCTAWLVLGGIVAGLIGRAAALRDHREPFVYPCATTAASTGRADLQPV